jgi:glycosyltransferase involved in cell wall biosynthesis
LRILHVITDLDVGGAELNLLRLIEATRDRVSHSVISLKEPGALADEIQALGVPVESVRMRPGIFSPTAILRAMRRILAFQPDVVHSWMYHANLIGGIAARAARVRPVLWGIHHAHPASGMKRRTRAVVRIGALLSRWLPQAILCNAETARDVHERMGYRKDKLIVIHNGFDVTVFTPDAQAGTGLRREFGIPQKGFVFGMAARHHPDKDPENFLDAAQRVLEVDPEVRFLWCGKDADLRNRPLVRSLRERDLEASFHLLGLQEDMPPVYNAMDALVSSSRSEAFPNVVGEAMACARPCVATDVGDVGRLLGDTGWIVPPRDPQALARAMLDVRALSPGARRELGVQARRRIVSAYKISDSIAEQLGLYRKLIEQDG